MRFALLLLAAITGCGRAPPSVLTSTQGAATGNAGTEAGRERAAGAGLGEAPSPSGRPDPGALAEAAGGSPCGGRHVDLTAAMRDARCVFYDEGPAETARKSWEARFTTKAPPVAAKVLEDGRIEVTLVNDSATELPVVLFLSQAIDLFPVVARRGARAVRVRAEERAGPGTARWSQGRNFARIVIAPGGDASVRLAIEPTIFHEDTTCAPNAKCSPSRIEDGALPGGVWDLEISLPVYALMPGKATVAWTKR